MELGDQDELESDKTEIEMPNLKVEEDEALPDSIHSDIILKQEQIHISLSSKSKIPSFSFEGSSSKKSTPFDLLDQIKDDDFTSES